jgi:hypothetical protein
VFPGEERSSLGSWYRFRSETPEGTLWWIDTATYRVTRTEYALADQAEPEVVSYRLDAFDTPGRIAAPGPCVTVTPVPEETTGALPDAPADENDS